MLEKPKLKNEKIANCLRDEYGLMVEKISFLPLGADANTAVYQVITSEETAYFVKLRKGEFTEASVTVPNFLSNQGIKQIIPIVRTQKGALWANLSPFKVILYPFVEGHHAFEKGLSHAQWLAFGAALKQFHSANVPLAITNTIQKENFSAQWRDILKMFLERIERETFHEPIAIELADFLKIKKDEMLEIIQRTELFAQTLLKNPPEFILCHADIHGWNLLIDKNGALYIVDWDTLLLAPKERDLMFIGAGLGDTGYTVEQEESMFYQGYGQTSINKIALAYYRYERIIEDIAAYCQQIFLSDEGGEDRNEALKNVKSNFLPNGTIEMANRSGNFE